MTDATMIDADPCGCAAKTGQTRAQLSDRPLLGPAGASGNEFVPFPVNTHVHLPPNFSAFADVADAVAVGVAEGVRAIGISNFYDQHVYGRFAQQAVAAGITPLYGLEFITLDEDLERAGVQVNDPANPGRFYLCGKGVNPFRGSTPAERHTVEPTSQERQSAETARAVSRSIRAGNDERAAEMVARVAAHLVAAGVLGTDASAGGPGPARTFPDESAGGTKARTFLDASAGGTEARTSPDAPSPGGFSVAAIAAEVARRGGVPVEWVSLQERHIAMAIQELLAELPLAERAAALERAYGRPSDVDIDDPVALQGELRSRLLRAGSPGFAPEVPVGFQAAYDCVLAMDGIPCYPTLADGATPVCGFEDPPDALAAELLARGIHAAELIPIRNTVGVVDEYVDAFTRAGIIVMAGTEHNTVERIPLDPACVDGPLSATAREAFWQGTCVVAAHQRLVADGEPGFVDASGARTARPVAELVALGASLITSGPVHGSHPGPA